MRGMVHDVSLVAQVLDIHGGGGTASRLDQDTPRCPPPAWDA